MSSDPADASELLVACLCAQWCRTCDTYRATLLDVRDALRAAHPQARVRFAWIDIEDEAELVGDVDIEDFPTVLLAHPRQVLFAGPVLPHAGTLQRLIDAALAGSLAPGAPAPGLAALVARLVDRPPL